MMERAGSPGSRGGENSGRLSRPGDAVFSFAATGIYRAAAIRPSCGTVWSWRGSISKCPAQATRKCRDRVAPDPWRPGHSRPDRIKVNSAMHRSYPTCTVMLVASLRARRSRFRARALLSGGVVWPAGGRGASRTHWGVERRPGPRRTADGPADPARGAVTAEQEHAELLDAVITGIFHAGLGLQTAMDLPAEAARRRVEKALADLDNIIREIRSSVFALPPPRPAAPARPSDDR
jgi:hypothetical protein